MDASGRLLIPKDLINHAKINKHIVISSAINILEIWDKSLYEKSINEATLDFGELAEEVMGDNMMTKFHSPVLLNEAIQGLKISPKEFMLMRHLVVEVILKLFWKC